MKVRTTAKSIREGWDNGKLQIGYCAAFNLLRCREPFAYTCGVYGWNFDAYYVHGYTITTGYRGMIGKSANYALLKEYDEKAKAIWEGRQFANDAPDWDERAAMVDDLLKEYLRREFEEVDR